jgi:hypothetical protein
VKQYISDNILGSTKNKFNLVLTIGYGNTINFEAFEFKPTQNSRVTHNVGVEIDPNTQVSHRVVRKTPLISLLSAIDLIRQSVSGWVDDVLFQGLEGWPSFSLGEAYFSWQRGVLEAVCQYFTNRVQTLDAQGVDRSKWPGEQTTLRSALKLWILVFLMGHQLTIPDNEKSRIGKILNITLAEGPVSPRFANKIVKMTIRPMVEKLTYDTLGGLHGFLRGNRNSRGWSCVFCIIILLLTVAAEIEISLDDIAACATVRGEVNRSRDDAAVEIRNLERNIPDTIITLFFARFKHPNNYNPFRLQRKGQVSGMDSATRELLRKVSESVEGDRE